MVILILFAFFAGLVTVLSPCILPVLPAILSASSTGGNRRPLGVICGLLVSFIFFTLTLTTLVHSFGISANVLRYVAIILIAFFGVVLFFPSLATGLLLQQGRSLISERKCKRFRLHRSRVLSAASLLVPPWGWCGRLVRDPF